MTPLPTSTLDAILTTQLVVAWAGEGQCQPPRLGWWKTDLIDPEGGGDLFARLLPRTHRWASFEAAREIARRVDDRARKASASGDKLRTLFHLGFELDEQLEDRLLDLKRQGKAPEDALPELTTATARFDRAELAAWLQADVTPGNHTVVPTGRQVKGAPPSAPELLVKHLAAALVPFADKYPAPFYAVR